DRGLPDTVHGLAQEPSDQHQRDQLREEDDLGGAAFGAFGRERRAGQEGEADSATGGREHGQPDLSSARAPNHGDRSRSNSPPQLIRRFEVSVKTRRFDANAIANYSQQG